MKKLTPALQAAYDKKKKPVTAVTETRVTMEIMEYYVTGGVCPGGQGRGKVDRIGTVIGV